LRELRLTHRPYQSPTALFGSPHLSQLERLALPAPATPGSMEALADSPMLANLRGLDVDHLAANADVGVAAVLRSKASAGRVELQLGGYGPEAPAAVGRAFAEASHLTNLRKLSVGWTSFIPPWVPLIVGAPHMAGVVDLEIHRCQLDEQAIKALLTSPYLGG